MKPSKLLAVMSFKEALGIQTVPSSVWLRQRLDDKASDPFLLCNGVNLRLLSRTQAPITPHSGYVCLDIDTVVMNNDNSKKTRQLHLSRY